MISPHSADDERDLAAIGVRRLVVPTPFGVGPVNTYLLEGPPLTLLDSGPNLASSLAVLERLIEQAGHRIDDLETLFVTHAHADHLGLTGLLADRSGASVMCLDSARGFMVDVERELRYDDEYAAALMLRHGVGDEIVEVLRSIAIFARSLAASTRVDVTVGDGMAVTLGGRSLEVQHRPGHSPHDTLLFDRHSRVLFGGDHLLSKISSNALVTRPADPDGDRPRPLLQYRHSLQMTRELDLDLVLGGHGPLIHDHRVLIDRRLAEQAERAEKILDVLQAGPLCAHEIASVIWGRIAFTQTFLTLSEVLGHIDLLIADGAVLEDGSSQTVRFQAV